MTSFVLGYSCGLLTPLVTSGLLLWWIARRTNKEAMAKFLHGMALVLNYKPKPPIESSNGKPVKEPNK